MNILSPISQDREVGFCIWLIPIRYIRFTNLCALGKILQEMDRVYILVIQHYNMQSFSEASEGTKA